MCKESQIIKLKKKTFSVLQEQPAQEYINTSLTSPPPMVNSAKADLIEPMICGSPRYSDSNTYYPNSWGTNMNYSNNYYYNNSNNNQQYINSPAPPTMVLYPHLYSTVNQNQIHLHLHGSADKIDYINHDISLTSTRSSIEIGVLPPAAVEVHSTQGQIEDSDRTHAQADPNVWRPY